MISALLYAVENGVGYVKKHPQLLLVLVLLIVIPFLFLYTGQQFLDAGKANQDRLQKDRVGLMHDVFVSLIKASVYDTTVIQREIASVASQNPDIKSFRFAKQEGRDIRILAALDETIIETIEENGALYKDAAVRLDESIIFQAQTSEGRMWHSYRALESENGEVYFVYVALSLAQIDAVFAQREQSALYSLVFVYVLIVALAYWHVRLTDYRYLFLEAKKANATKDLFTNMIAHELRAPLTAIKGYASMVEEAHGTFDEKTEQYPGRIRESADRLLTLVNDLLDVARIQSGKLSVENTNVPIVQLIEKVLQELYVSAEEKKIQLKQTYTTEPVVVADPARLQQVVTNLVSNAIKYTKEGIIELSVEEKADSVELRVKDTGMGISSEDQKKLFAPFFRVASTDVSKITGTGLGMWITKQLVELMGAKIGVESIKGVGTHIVISLPKQTLQ